MHKNWRDDFDPDALANIAEAFDVAWDFIQKTELAARMDQAEQREQLATILFLMARSGETNKLILANKAINRIRDSVTALVPNCARDGSRILPR